MAIHVLPDWCVQDPWVEGSHPVLGKLITLLHKLSHFYGCRNWGSGKDETIDVTYCCRKNGCFMGCVMELEYIYAEWFLFIFFSITKGE